MEFELHFYTEPCCKVSAAQENFNVCDLGQFFRPLLDHTFNFDFSALGHF